MPRERRLSFEHCPGAKSSIILKFSNSSVFVDFFFFRFLVQISLFCVFRVSKHSVILKNQKFKNCPIGSRQGATVGLGKKIFSLARAPGRSRWRTRVKFLLPMSERQRFSRLINRSDSKLSFKYKNIRNKKMS